MNSHVNLCFTCAFVFAPPPPPPRCCSYSVWAMLHAHSFKHLAVETPEMGREAFIKRWLQHKVFWWPQGSKKTLFWGKCPTACSSRSPACSGFTRWAGKCRMSTWSFPKLKVGVCCHMGFPGSKNLFSNIREGGSKRKVLVAKVAV